MQDAKLQQSVRVLLLTYYFPPDLSAGSFRAEALANALIGSDTRVELDVVTTTPNRYASHRPDVDVLNWEGLSIRRVVLPETAPGLMGHARSFFTFAKGGRSVVPGKQYDVVVATSSRLMTACLGAWLARQYRAPLYLDIRDIFVETIDDVFPSWWLAPARWLFDRLERWPMKAASRTNLVSEGFLPYFRDRYGDQDYRFFTNGVDEEFMHLEGGLDTQLPCQRTGDVPHIVYAGNIGDGQGLDTILPALACRLAGRARFTVIGDGGKQAELRKQSQDMGASIEFLAPLPRTQLIDIYRSADVLFLHLNDLPAFRRVLPSKLFEYAALGKPILAGVSGYAAEFVRENVKGAALFEPCDVEGAVEAFDCLPLQVHDRGEFVARFSRKKIMERLAADIIDTACSASSG